MTMTGAPNKQNHLLEGGPLVVEASLAGWVFQEPIWISVPVGIVVRGCIWLQWIHFEDLFNVFANFMIGDLWARLPTSRRVFRSFWSKTAWPLCPTLSIHPNLRPREFILFPWVENSPQRETLCQHGKGETKHGRSTRNQWSIKINEFKDCSEQWKNVLVGVLAQVESTL